MTSHHSFSIVAKIMQLMIDLTGGSAIWRIAAYSYISDISEPQMRTKRIAVCDGMFLMGFYIGNMLGGPVKENLGFGFNFSFGMLCALLAVAWCALFVKDSKQIRDARLRKEIHLDENGATDLPVSSERKTSVKSVEKLSQDSKQKSEDGVINKLCGSFKASRLTEGFETVFKNRGGSQRMCIIISIAAITLDSFAARGKWQNLFLYFRKVLNWTITQYSSFMSSLGLIGAISNYILVPFLSQKLHMNDSTIAIIDTATSVIR